jgi:hypothetical protein
MGWTAFSRCNADEGGAGLSKPSELNVASALRLPSSAPTLQPFNSPTLKLA